MTQVSDFDEDAWALGTRYREESPCGCAAVIETAWIEAWAGADDGRRVPGWTCQLDLCEDHRERESDPEVCRAISEAGARLMNETIAASPLLVSVLDRVTGSG